MRERGKEERGKREEAGFRWSGERDGGKLGSMADQRAATLERENRTHTQWKRETPAVVSFRACAMSHVTALT
jgi:hypothetical protein